MLNKILFFRNWGEANWILLTALVSSAMMINSHELKGQCAHIYDQAFTGSYTCGCWVTNIRITDLPTNRIGKLSLTVKINNAQDLIWNNQYMDARTVSYNSQTGRIQPTYKR